MRRRHFLALLGAAATWPARAQQDGRMPRVAVLIPFADSDPEAQIWFKTFVNEMQAVGWTDGGNIRIDVRWAGGEVGQANRLAA
jgi:putative tryptophan/tyrosine transport system substrate-binding protein